MFCEPRSSNSWGLLQRHQSEHHAFAFVESAHGFAQDRSLSPAVVGGPHRVAARIGGGEQVSWTDRSVACIGLDIDAPAQRDVHTGIHHAFLAQAYAWVDAVGAADDPGDARVVS